MSLQNIQHLNIPFEDETHSDREALKKKLHSISIMVLAIVTWEVDFYLKLNAYQNSSSPFVATFALKSVNTMVQAFFNDFSNQLDTSRSNANHLYFIINRLDNPILNHIAITYPVMELSEALLSHDGDRDLHIDRTIQSLAGYTLAVGSTFAMNKIHGLINRVNKPYASILGSLVGGALATSTRSYPCTLLASAAGALFTYCTGDSFLVTSLVPLHFFYQAEVLETFTLLLIQALICKIAIVTLGSLAKAMSEW